MTAALCIAFVWGAVWAMFLQRHSWGRWLAVKRTWLAVVVGVGVDLVILLLILEPHVWTGVVAVIGASSVGIIVRSLYNEHGEDVA